MRVSLIGGGGLLGRAIEPVLADRGHAVESFSRSSDPPVDLTTGEGLETAISGSDVVVHLASNPASAKRTDIAGTRRILDAIEHQHLIYMSIVGVDRHPFPYYRAKYEAEQMIVESGVAHTIVRATQFHDFLEYLMSKACRRRLAFVPSGFVFQPIDTGEVAGHVAHVIETSPTGLQPDLAGPEILQIQHIARSYMSARGREAPLIEFPVPGKTGSAFRNGLHTNRERAVGAKSWQTYLDETFQG